MSKKKEKFDVNQGHGDHFPCVTELETPQFITTYLVQTVNRADTIVDTKDPVPCNFGDGWPSAMPMILLGELQKPIRVNALVAVIERGKQSTLVSGYPECDGAEVSVKITAVHEWSAGVEATIEGEVLGEAQRPIAFFDTRYVANKGKYKVGKIYTFRLSAFAYSSEVVPLGEREFRIEGADAVKRRKDFGEEQKYDKNGNPEPLIFRTDKMVAFFSSSVAYPDDAEYQSPVFSKVRTLKEFGTEFMKFDIAIAREDEDVIIPLIVRKSLMVGRPKKGDPVRGRLWLQGYCVE